MPKLDELKAAEDAYDDARDAYYAAEAAYEAAYEVAYEVALDDAYTACDAAHVAYQDELKKPKENK